MSATHPITSETRLASARAWKERNKERVNANLADYRKRIRQDPLLQEKRLRQSRESAKRNFDKRREYDKARDKEKTNARALIRNRIKRGKLIRGSCEKCGLPNAQAHHDDYSKPLEVRWLCSKHHKEFHLEHDAAH